MTGQKPDSSKNYSNGPLNQDQLIPPMLGGELEDLERELGKKAHPDYRDLSWAERTFFFTLAWDQAQRKRLGSLKTYFSSFEPRWLRPDWVHFNQARVLADGAHARYEDWIAFQIERAKATDLFDLDLSFLHDTEALSQGYRLFLGKEHNPSREVRPLLKLWAKVDLAAEQRARKMVETASLGVDEETTWEEKLKALLVLATKDSLTGLANEDSLKKSLTQEWDRLCRQQEPLSLVLCSLDNFRHFVEKRGNQAKDACLRLMAGMLSMELRRPADLAACLAENHFALLLPHTPAEGAVVVADRIRREVRKKGIVHPESSMGVVTASFGAATLIPQKAYSAKDLLRAAARALGRAVEDQVVQGEV
ncbi:GGDEF domain-containing protein [Dethiosulfatarculus sandiegensis]|uniref:diguanylate cyclase n=1 Tax=Dethiosulfatarculus sandiegensis TaxID=1429043 RepID=A0A0D2JG18_9BACT|nr:diguanylate cyclase [Dethiosulfatarculus sandiegensis]KIX14661.1 hypothetical protein X474_08330 [Dethiosulfatarculus sandiegensis]